MSAPLILKARRGRLVALKFSQSSSGREEPVPVFRSQRARQMLGSALRPSLSLVSNPDAHFAASAA